MFILIPYLYFALKHTKIEPDTSLLVRVLVNIVIAELAFWIGAGHIPVTESFSVWRLLGFFILQDLWFYSTHVLFHHIPYLYQFHKIHHSAYAPVYAWLAHPVDHIIIHLGSVAVPFMVCNNPDWVLIMLCVLESWSSVTGHADGTPHHTHHIDMTKRYGSIYLFDRMFGSY